MSAGGLQQLVLTDDVQHIRIHGDVGNRTQACDG